MATTKSILCFAALLLSPLSVEASCTLGPHADGAGRAKASDPDTYSDVCIDRLREQGSTVWLLSLKCSLDHSEFTELFTVT